MRLLAITATALILGMVALSECISQDGCDFLREFGRRR